LPGTEPCASNLSLNSVPLDLSAPWSFAPKLVQGTTTLNSSGHDLNVNWSSACIDDDTSTPSNPASQVLTLKVNSVDGRRIDESLSAGFTLSFKEANPPEFLRLSSLPIDPEDIDESWTNPPASLRIQPEQDFEDPVLEQHLEELHFLEAEAELIQKLIKEKKQLISQRLVEDLKISIHQCDGIFCYFKVVFSHAHKSASALYHRHSPNPFASFLDPQGFVLQTGAKQTTMIAPSENQTLSSTAISPTQPHSPTKTVIRSLPSGTSSSVDPTLPSTPEKCHCKEDDIGGWPALPERPSTGRSSRNDGARASKLWIILQVFFTITGLALIFSLVKKCCGSRKPKSNPTPRRTDRVTINTGRKKGFWSWVSKKKAEKAAARASKVYRNMDEKRALVNQQEGYLEDHMQDEIRQLKIHEELRQLSDTRNQVDELIRAEEGRGPSAPPYVANPFASSSSPYVTRAMHSNRSSHHSGHSIPHPIDIPSRHTSYQSQQGHQQPIISPSSLSDAPFSPVSRTTSLPSYRSKPPSYQGEGSSYAFSDSDAGTDGDLDQDQDAWTSSDDSSIPDLSPRPSGETLRTHYTGETARTFL
jgi:hypothetical protein